MIIQYAAPSKFTTEPYGTIYKVMGETKGDLVEFDYYIQTSSEKEMRWVELGTVLEIALEAKLADHKYIADILKLYSERLDLKKE
jgi:hypothetical protein